MSTMFILFEKGQVPAKIPRKTEEEKNVDRQTYTSTKVKRHSIYLFLKCDCCKEYQYTFFFILNVQRVINR